MMKAILAEGKVENMKYMIINELYEKGGTEIQSLREKRLFESHGHQILYVTFDPECSRCDSEGHINIKKKYTVLSKAIYRMIEDKKLTMEIRSIINDFNPDLIHLNNTLDHALSIFKAVSGYPVFQTIRDYTAVCPTGLCVNKNWQVCRGRKYGNCLLQCTPHNKKGRFYHYYLVGLRVFQSRTKYIKQFVCPSETLTAYCKQHGMDTVCINNPFDFSVMDKIVSSKESKKEKIFLFYGFITEHKGIIPLLEAFEVFSRGKNVELWIVGECQLDLMERIEPYYEKFKMKYLGKLSYMDTLKILNQAYAVVVPSLWMENYPNTVLEALAFEKIVLASNRGGMREMIRDERFIFDVLDQKDMLEKLNFAYFLSEDEYLEITQRNKEFILTNNSLDKYYDRIMNLFEKVREENYGLVDSYARNCLGGGRTTIQIPNREYQYEWCFCCLSSYVQQRKCQPWEERCLAAA